MCIYIHTNIIFHILQWLGFVSNMKSTPLFSFENSRFDVPSFSRRSPHFEKIEDVRNYFTQSRSFGTDRYFSLYLNFPVFRSLSPRVLCLFRIRFCLSLFTHTCHVLILYKLLKFQITPSTYLSFRQII